MFDEWQTMQGILADVLLNFTLAGEVGYVLLGGGTERIQVKGLLDCDLTGGRLA